MNFEVEIGGHRRLVSVEAIDAAGPSGGRFRVTLRLAEDRDSETSADRARVEIFELDAFPTELGVSILFAADKRGLDVAVTGRRGGEQLIEFPHGSVTAVVDGRRFRGVTSEAAADGEQRITAPMPGRVLRVLVAPGEQVAARQGIVVVEAMKMENELAAVRAGRVRDIAVSEGALVEAGRLLVVIE